MRGGSKRKRGRMRQRGDNLRSNPPKAYRNTLLSLTTTTTLTSSPSTQIETTEKAHGRTPAACCPLAVSHSSSSSGPRPGRVPHLVLTRYVVVVHVATRSLLGDGGRFVCVVHGRMRVSVSQPASSSPCSLGLRAGPNPASRAMAGADSLVQNQGALLILYPRS